MVDPKKWLNKTFPYISPNSPPGTPSVPRPSIKGMGNIGMPDEEFNEFPLRLGTDSVFDDWTYAKEPNNADLERINHALVNDGQPKVSSYDEYVNRVFEESLPLLGYQTDPEPGSHLFPRWANVGEMFDGITGAMRQYVVPNIPVIGKLPQQGDAILDEAQRLRDKEPSERSIKDQLKMSAYEGSKGFQIANWLLSKMNSAEIDNPMDQDELIIANIANLKVAGIIPDEYSWYDASILAERLQPLAEQIVGGFFLDPTNWIPIKTFAHFAQVRKLGKLVHISDESVPPAIRADWLKSKQLEEVPELSYPIDDFITKEVGEVADAEEVAKFLDTNSKSFDDPDVLSINEIESSIQSNAINNRLYNRNVLSQEDIIQMEDINPEFGIHDQPIRPIPKKTGGTEKPVSKIILDSDHPWGAYVEFDDDLEFKNWLINSQKPINQGGDLGNRVILPTEGTGMKDILGAHKSLFGGNIDFHIPLQISDINHRNLISEADKQLEELDNVIGDMERTLARLRDKTRSAQARADASARKRIPKQDFTFGGRALTDYSEPLKFLKTAEQQTAYATKVHRDLNRAITHRAERLKMRDDLNRLIRNSDGKTLDPTDPANAGYMEKSGLYVSPEMRAKGTAYSSDLPPQVVHQRAKSSRRQPKTPNHPLPLSARNPTPIDIGSQLSRPEGSQIGIPNVFYSDHILGGIIKPLGENMPITSMDDSIARLNLMRLFESVYQSYQPWKLVNDNQLLYDTFMRMMGDESLPNQLSPLFSLVGQRFVDKTVEFLQYNPGKSVEATDILAKTFREIAASDIATTQDRLVLLQILDQMDRADPSLYKRTKISKSIVNKHKKIAVGYLQMSILTKHPEKLFAKLPATQSLTDFGFTRPEMMTAYGKAIFTKARKIGTDDLADAANLHTRTTQIIAKLMDIPHSAADFHGYGNAAFFKAIPARLRYIPQRIYKFGDAITEQAALANISVEEMRVKTATYTTMRQMWYIQQKHPSKKFYLDPENVIRESEKQAGLKPAGRIEITKEPPEANLPSLLRQFTKENEDIMPNIRQSAEAGGQLWKEWIVDALEFGRISKAEFDEIVATYPYYIPMRYQGLTEMDNLPLADKGTALNLRDGTATAVDAALSDPLYRIDDYGKMEAVDNWMENLVETFYTRSVNLYYNDVTKSLVENLRFVHTHTLNVSKVDKRPISVALKEYEDTFIYDLKLTKTTRDGEEKLVWANGGAKIPKRLSLTHSHVRYWDDGVAHDILMPNKYHRELIQSVKTNVKRTENWSGRWAMALNNPIKKALITLDPAMVANLTVVDIINTWFAMPRKHKKSLQGLKGGNLMREVDVTSHTMKTIGEIFKETKASGSIWRAGLGTSDREFFAKHGGSLSGFIRHSGDQKLITEFNNLLNMVEPGVDARRRMNLRTLHGGRGGYWFGKKQGIPWQDTMRDARQPDPASTVAFRDQLENPVSRNAYGKTIDAIKGVRDNWIKKHPKTSLWVQNVLIDSDLQRIAENPGWYIDQLAGASEVGTRQRLYKANLEYYQNKPRLTRTVRQSEIDASNPYGAMADDFMDELPEADELRTVLEFPDTKYGQGFYDDIFNNRRDRDLIAAIHKSRNTMIDYDQAGTAIRLINQYFMFANPAIQGIAKIPNLLKADPQAFMAAVRMLGTLVVGSYAWNIQHPEYKNVDIEERLTKIIIMKPSGLQSGIPGEASYWTLGGSMYEWSVFVTAYNSFLMSFSNKDPKLAMSFVNDVVMEDLNPVTWMQPEGGEEVGPKFPTYILNSMWQIFNGRDSWGRPVHSSADKLKPVNERYDANTTELAKRVSKSLGKWHNISPKQIDAIVNFGVQKKVLRSYERILSIDEKIRDKMPNDKAEDAIDTLAGLYSMDHAILDDLGVDPKTKSSMYMLQREILANIDSSLHEDIKKAARMKANKTDIPIIGAAWDVGALWMDKFNHQKGRSFYSTSIEDPFQDTTGILAPIYDALAMVKEPPTRQSIEGFHAGPDDPYIVDKVSVKRQDTIKLNQEIERIYQTDMKIRENHQSLVSLTAAMDVVGNPITNYLEEDSPPLFRHDVWRWLNTQRIKDFQSEIQFEEGSKVLGSSKYPEALKVAVTEADHSMLRQNFMRGAINDARNYGADDDEIFEMENDIIWYTFQGLGANSFNSWTEDIPNPIQVWSMNSYAWREEIDEIKAIVMSMPRGEERWEIYKRRQDAGKNPVEREHDNIIDSILSPHWDQTHDNAVELMVYELLNASDIRVKDGKILLDPHIWEESKVDWRSGEPTWVDPREEIQRVLRFSDGELNSYKKGPAESNSSYRLIYQTYINKLSKLRQIARAENEDVDYELVKWGYPGNPQSARGQSLLQLYQLHDSQSPDDPGIKTTTDMKKLVEK